MLCQGSPHRLANQEAWGGPRRAPGRALAWTKTDQRLGPTSWPGAFNPPFLSSNHCRSAFERSFFPYKTLLWPIQLTRSQARQRSRMWSRRPCPRMQPPAPANQPSLTHFPKAPCVFLHCFMLFCLSSQKIQNTAWWSFNFSRTFIHIFVSFYLLPLDFYWPKNCIACRQTNYSLERSNTQCCQNQLCHVLCMGYMYFSFSHPFMVVNCPILTVSKNISCLMYMYLFEYCFSCVTEMLRNPSTFFKSYLGTFLFKYHWLFSKVTSLLKIGFRCMMI